MGGFDRAAECVDDELHAVADAEDGQLVLFAVFEKAVGHAGGALHVDAVGAAREDDGAWVGAGDALLWCGGAWQQHGSTARAVPWRRRRA